MLGRTLSPELLRSFAGYVLGKVMELGQASVCYSRDFAHKLARFTLMSRMQSVQMWARMKSAQGRMAFLFSPKIPLFFLYNKIFVEETQWQLLFLC